METNDMCCTEGREHLMFALDQAYVFAGNGSCLAMILTKVEIENGVRKTTVDT